MEEVISQEAKQRLEKIHKLSLQYNGGVDKAHQRKLLELMRKHIDEIEQLASDNNNHFLIETGDLIILCFELLLEQRQDMDAVVVECFGRYERKLTLLLKQKNIS